MMVGMTNQGCAHIEQCDPTESTLEDFDGAGHGLMKLDIQEVNGLILVWVFDLGTIDYTAKRQCAVSLYEKIDFHYLADWFERLRAASSYWSVEQLAYWGLPHTGVPEIVSPQYANHSTF
jgi:hypothetical protein